MVVIICGADLDAVRTATADIGRFHLEVSFGGLMNSLWCSTLEAPIAARLCNEPLEFLARSHQGRYVQTAAPPLLVSLGNV